VSAIWCVFRAANPTDARQTDRTTGKAWSCGLPEIVQAARLLMSGSGKSSVVDNFRHRLRGATRPEHERVDARVSQFDLSTREGLCSYLAGLQAALTVIAARFPSPSPDWLHTCRKFASADLDLLGAGAHSRTLLAECWGDATEGLSGDPRGWLYVVLGSQFGAEFLSNRRRASADQLVLAAGAYLSNTEMRGAWRDLMAVFATTEADRSEAQGIIDGARSAFLLFEKMFAEAAALTGAACVVAMEEKSDYLAGNDRAAEGL
jgi:heme oxygenase